MSKSIHEECGVFGIYRRDNFAVATSVYYGLFALQHRGQEGCGIVVNDEGQMTDFKDVGLVNDVFTPERLLYLGKGQMGLGHVLDSVNVPINRAHAQPVTINHIKGSMALASNGNIINSQLLRRELELTGSIFHTLSDSEIIAALITRQRLRADSIEEAISRTLSQLEGAYSMVVMSPRKLMAIRDPRGFRPLCLGKLADGYVISSETCGLDAVGASFLRDVEPGEIVVIDAGGLRSSKTHCRQQKKSLCAFEYLYFARPDSVLDGTPVHEARKRAGALLALTYPLNADVVIGVPDSGLDAAMGYSQQAGIPYGLGFIKNKYIGRTFTEVDEVYRESRVRIKLNVVTSTVKGKRVVMIDDSIVRGTTCARMVRLLRHAGATEVHVRSSAPPFINTCYFGIGMDSRENLIACHHSVEEIAQIIGADSLAYLSINDIDKLQDVGGGGLCDACFTDNYPLSPAQGGQLPAPKDMGEICRQADQEGPGSGLRNQDRGGGEGQ